MTEPNMKLVKKMLADKNVSFDDFYTFLRDKEWGDWDDINSEDVLKQYITEKMNEGVHVSHMVAAMEKHSSEQELWAIWLGNSMNTPKPINNKSDLFKALFT